jgi:hypothetical protein
MILASSGAPARAVIAVTVSKRTAPLISAREASVANGALAQVAWLIYYITSTSGQFGASWVYPWRASGIPARVHYRKKRSVAIPTRTDNPQGSLPVHETMPYQPSGDEFRR